MSRSANSDSEDDSRSKKKPKRTGPSLLQLEREKYMSGGAATKGKKAKREEVDLTDVLEGFKKRVIEAKVNAPEPVALEEKAVGWDEEDDDEDWLGHSLVFRKDATLDRRKSFLTAPATHVTFKSPNLILHRLTDTIDEYVSIDPLSKNTMDLHELKAKADNAGRKYPGEKRDEGDRRGGDSRRGGAGGGRGGGRGGRGRERVDRGGGFGEKNEKDNRDGGRSNQSGEEDGRTQGRSTTGASWKQDRVGQRDLA
ncbi:hypothetical protein P7C70_g6905, partial [Phenoliferia sp. Uapishka_3]